jgi:hypothetical protein
MYVTSELYASNYKRHRRTASGEGQNPLRLGRSGENSHPQDQWSPPI